MVGLFSCLFCQRRGSLLRIPLWIKEKTASDASLFCKSHLPHKRFPVVEEDKARFTILFEGEGLARKLL